MAEFLLRFRPPRIAMLLLALAGAVHWLLLPPTLALSGRAVAGLALAAAGFATMMVAWWQFRQHAVLICPTAETTALITDGIYRWSRNPMYLGMTCMLAGIAVISGGLPFYAVAVLQFAILDRAFCPYEERKLSDVFGASYDRYRRTTRRWI